MPDDVGGRTEKPRRFRARDNLDARPSFRRLVEIRAEIPELIKIADKYKDKGVVVLGLAQQDTPEDLRAFAAEHKMNYPSLLSTEAVEEAFGPMWAVPMSFIIDRAGSICFKHIGPVTMPQVEKALQPLL